MKRLPIIILIMLAAATLLIAILRNPPIQSGNSNNQLQNSTNLGANLDKTNSSTEQKIDFQSPLDNPQTRITKKPFGIYITPKNSPVQPERFAGYHTGVDFELLPDELDKEATVTAFCNGPIIQKGWANGYGGYVIQQCSINKETVTALYGHLNVSTVPAQGVILAAGAKIGVLGKGFSSETDQERKHLHFALHKGGAVELKGYVANQSALEAWINPVNYFNN
ncbi:MAG: hypothetical protein COY66_04085 [Candidatus Kerfeldbacteria bacterium CG_4_10_14_0_8_um_filter_42_10]|uniref:M23ase beta-sheet core domain-containing protein n=1 Tax=Candidatus Kerfeldbacteria bacterium CG_4_10_14_0_8_um_filter_42_10 TaxID=2014248 RepID=A0A2M7RI58_9BACT|nr:MAG: hypothetical protein COY66_04085 [Candidatus Kerfeldbacteria bacterium CG_4_10_14_0_8_um_filter_42_10]